MIKTSAYLKAKTIDQALNWTKQFEDSFKYLAGGTDVMVNKFQGNMDKSCLIDLTDIEDLMGVKEAEDGLHIGALTTLSEIECNNQIIENAPILISAVKAVASPLIRNTATIGGNLLCENRCIFYNQSEWWREAAGYCLKCNGDICIATGGKKACFSEFVSDTAPALIVMNAKVTVVDFDGTKTLRVEDIYSGDGVNPRTLSKTAILKEIIIPVNSGIKSCFKKLRQRESLEFTALTSAVSLNSEGKIKIALAGVDPRPVVVEGCISDNKDELIKVAIKSSRAIDNDMLSRAYRKEMIGIFLHSSFKELEIED